MLDPALRRPGRLDREVEVGVPDQQGRAEVCVQLIEHVSCVMLTSAATRDNRTVTQMRALSKLLVIQHRTISKKLPACMQVHLLRI
jgi:ATP-dependent 26S proteasome regulatory subunit